MFYNNLSKRVRINCLKDDTEICNPSIFFGLPKFLKIPITVIEFNLINICSFCHVFPPISVKWNPFYGKMIIVHAIPPVFVGVVTTLYSSLHELSFL